jgi:flagellar biosynthesis anti-sigma factor FlgM
MQISNKQIESVFRAVSDQLRSEKAGRQKKGDQAGPSGDQALISSQASELSRFREFLAKIPDVREDRIAGLAEKISAGQYRPSAMEMAEKMLIRELADRLK